MDKSGLTKEEIDEIRTVFSKYQQVEEVLLYGSRAMGNYKPASDIDVTLKGKNINLSLRTEIEFDLDDLMLPYKFDISIYDKISNPEFLDHINRVGKEMYRKNSNHLKKQEMNTGFKPKNYNSVSPYFVVDDAEKLIDLLKDIFGATELRRYENADGTIMHAEILLDDSVLMFGNSSDRFPPVPMVLHVYVPNVDETFDKVVKAGCEIIEPPKEQEGDPDRRATFKDFAGNMWSIGTQVNA